MVHEAMVLEYSGRHLALIELAGVAEAAALRLADRLRVRALGARRRRTGAASPRSPSASPPMSASSRSAASCSRVFETSIAKMRVFRVPDFLGAALMLGLLGDAAALRVAELLMNGLDFDIAHLLAGGLVLVSFMLLYQDRLYALLNVFALHALVLALSVAWQAYIQDAPHLYITAAIALGLQGDRHPGGAAPDHRAARHPSRDRDRGRRRPDHAGRHGAGRAVDGGDAARSPPDADPLAREDLAFALSVVLLGLLMMVTRRNAVSQVVGFMSLENGLVLAATGAKGMPLVVEISVAFSVLVAFIVIGIFLFRIRERFDTVDVQALDRFRGERAMSARSMRVAAVLLDSRRRGRAARAAAGLSPVGAAQRRRPPL